MTVTITTDALSATIAPLGAELQTLRDAAGHDLLWDGDPAFWTGRAPLLFPIVGEVPDDTIHVDGKTYELKRHGFARKSMFTLQEQTPSACVWGLEASPATLAHYPFEFALRVRYALDGATLSISARVDNRGDRPMPTSFGFHPAFRWPLPGGGTDKTACRVIFDEDEPAPIRRLEANLLKPEPEPTPVKGRELALDDSLFEPDALVFDALRSRGLTYAGPSGPQLRIAFPNMPDLGIWSKPGAGFVCIEPWQGTAAPQGFSGAFAQKPGLVAITPGGSRDFGMSVTLVVSEA